MDELKASVLRPLVWLGNSLKNPTPKHEVDLIRQRYTEAQELANGEEKTKIH